MLHKCANPACSARPTRFPDGRLFMRYRKCLPGEQAAWGGRCVEHYWLCQTCAATLMVVFGSDGVFVRPRTERLPCDGFTVA